MQYLKRVLKRLGLSGHLHTFRHAFISHALTQGVPEAVLKQWVGHVDADTLKIYTHISDEASQRGMQRLADAVPHPLQDKQKTLQKKQKKRFNDGAKAPRSAQTRDVL